MIQADRLTSTARRWLGHKLAAAPSPPCATKSILPRPPFAGDRTSLLMRGLRAPDATRAANEGACAPRRRGMYCQALNVDPVLQALPAIGGATAGAVVGVPAAVIAALVVTGLSKMVEGSLNKDDKISFAGLTATVGVEALVLMAHMTVGAVVSCAITGRPTL